MIKVLILDLDGTLIDTASLEPLRDAKRWQEIKQYLSSCSLHEEILKLLNKARSAGIKVAIFTNTPSKYAQSLLSYFDISVDLLVSYHDVANNKPHREGVDKIITNFGVTNHETVYVGDSNLDRDAASNAEVDFYAVEWGSTSNVNPSNIGVSKLMHLVEAQCFTRPEVSRSGLQYSGNMLYLGYYLEDIRQEVFLFKDNEKAAVERWTLKTLELAEYFPAVDVVVRALGHSELNVSDTNKPLDKLATKLADTLGVKYLPKALRKIRKLTKSSECSAAERRTQVRGTYYLNRNAISQSQYSKPTFLVVDDVRTSGATTSEISRAINEVFPEASIYIFTLVKTLYRAEVSKAVEEIQQNIQLLSDLYSPIDATSQKAFEVPVTKAIKKKNKLVNRTFSASYARTNHNFILQNLRPYSIACEPNSAKLFSAIQILKNILQRGKPTIASRGLRRSFGIDHTESGHDAKATALISKKPVRWSRLIRGEEKKLQYPAKRFFDELLPKYLGEYEFVKQLMVPEVKILDMTQIYVEQYHNQQVDFFIPHLGLIIEIDGYQHQQSNNIDVTRDEFTKKLGFKTIRFTTQEIASECSAFIQKIREICEHVELTSNLEKEGVLLPPNGITLQDYKKAFINGVDPSDRVMRLTAAVRFQMLLLELLERGMVRIDRRSTLLLVNRDRIDFARNAVDDLNEILTNLLQLRGVTNVSLDLEIKEIPEIPKNKSRNELVIDFSILERFDDTFQVNHDVIYSRTHYFDFYRDNPKADVNSIEASTLIDYDFFQMSCTDPVKYDIDLSPDSGQRESLRYFLSNIFLPFDDDVDFREGQVGIIGSALSRRGTIGLLPTGSGKSICYQLSAMLQPAVSFVVCPIKSLMYDQKADLDSIGLTRSNFITSELKADEKAKIQRDFGRGKYFFIFISPERFQTQAFRAEMKAIGLDHEFAYSVIDEVHCLSEWGHDFRTSYLNLANTIQKFAPSASYIGLTATASVNVLKDIQTEFNISDDFVRMPMNFTRHELSFKVINDKGRKTDKLLELVGEMEAKWNGEGETPPKAGIIFTPTVNGDKGCHSLAARLSSGLGMDVRFFSGSRPRNGSIRGDAFDSYKRRVQQDFKFDKFRLLTATKAFGMGVNKENIAYSIHFGLPSSMEALYQEAGRAGRNKKLFKSSPADCYVLLTKESNKSLLNEIWDSSINVSDLKSHRKRLSRHSDVNMNLFLMTKDLETINHDFKLIKSIYGYLKENDDQQVVTVAAKQFGSEKAKFEKAIYRLSQLGVISDWVIEDFFGGRFSLEFQCLNEENLVKNLQSTIRKYEPNFDLDDVFTDKNKNYMILCERLHNGSIDKTQFVFLVLLLWSYDHFAYNRRQSLKTVYEQCSHLSEGKIDEKEFKDRLEGYFKFNESSHKLMHLVEDSVDSNLWLSVFFEGSIESAGQKIISKGGLLTLREQLSRFLESYKDNTCLNYLSGVARLTDDQFDDFDGERRMSSALDYLISRDRASALDLVRQTLRLKSLFSHDAQIRFARLVHEKFSETSVLELVNGEFGDPYTYRMLLAPLVTKLENYTNTYKRIQW